MRAGVIRPYKPAKHRHTGEIEQELSQTAGRKIKVSMSPHAVDVVRVFYVQTIHSLRKILMKKNFGRYTEQNIVKNDLSD